MEDKDVTLFITSCGRPHLLKRTLASFVKHNTYPINAVILCEDSGIKGIADFAQDIFTSLSVHFCYNEIRIGQMKTIEKYAGLIKTPFVFHLEDDYEFFDSGFIELSFKILDSDPKISQVLLEDDQHGFHKVPIGNPLCDKIMTSDPDHPQNSVYNSGDGALSVFSWRPSLKRTEIARLRIPYAPWDDEYTIQLAVNKLGFYGVVTRNLRDGRRGFCTHIGKTDHVPSQVADSNIKILGRIDFPDKINLRIRDI